MCSSDLTTFLYLNKSGFKASYLTDKIQGIGIILLMGLTMYLQQKINPPPPDPIQAKIFMMLPFIFTFLLATFPSGMVVYWTVNNVLSIGQQYILLKKQKKE